MSGAVGPAGSAGPAAGDELILCRCECVTVADLARAADRLDVRSLRQLKLWTRAGMGICQGRVCRPALEGIAEHLGLDRGEGELRVRPPLCPVDLGTLAGGAAG